MSRMRGLMAVAVALVGAGGLSACEDASASEGSQDVTLSFATRPSASAQVLADPITAGGHTLDIASVDVTLSEVVLERAEGNLGGGDSDGSLNDGDSDADSEADSDSDGSANERFRSGPITVALPLSGGTITPITQAIPAGTYEQLEVDIAFMRLRGTYDGQPFDVTVAVDEEFEAQLSPLFVVDDETDRPNLTITLNVADWFRTDTGLVDPRQLAANGALRALLIRNIEMSFDAFEDSDRDADDADSDSDRDSDRR